MRSPFTYEGSLFAPSVWVSQSKMLPNGLLLFSTILLQTSFVLGRDISESAKTKIDDRNVTKSMIHVRRKNDTLLEVDLESRIELGYVEYGSSKRFIKKLAPICNNDTTVIPTCLGVQQVKLTCPRATPGAEAQIRGDVSDELYQNVSRFGAGVIEENLSLTKRDCRYCWNREEKRLFIDRTWQDYVDHRRSPSVIFEYYDCASSKSVKKIEYDRDIHARVAFQCWDDGKIEEEHEVEWYFLGPYNNLSQLLTPDDDASTNYTINRVGTSDAGAYRCLIWFKQPQFRYARDFQLRLRAPPLKPIEIVWYISPGTNYVITLLWQSNPLNALIISDKSGDEKSFEIRYYRVEIDQSIIDQSGIDQSITVITNGTRAELPNLNPFTVYVIGIAEKNAFGKSEPLKFIVFFQNSSEGLRDLEIVAPLDQSVTLPCYKYGNVSGIEWFKVHSNSTSFPIEEAKFQNKYTIEKVKKADGDFYYGCRVPYDGAELRHYFTISLVVLLPPPPPADFRCTNGQEKNLKLTWKPAPGQNSEKRGPLLAAVVDRFRVRYKKLGSAPSWNGEKIISNNETETTIKNLEGGLYVFRLVSVNRVGESEPLMDACSVS